MNNSRYSPTDISSHLGDLTQLLTPYEGEPIPISDLKLSNLLSLPSVATLPALHTDALPCIVRCPITPD